jgi:hypothetical protein
MNILYVYTAIAGGFNDGLGPIHIPIDPRGRSVRCVCFTDSIRLGPQGWELRPLLSHSRNDRLTARWHKIMSHRVLPEASLTIWHDGSHHLVSNPWRIVDQCLSKQRTFASFKHPDRNCTYEEANACIKLLKDHPDRLRMQVDSYRQDGFPAHYGLLETSCVARVQNAEVAQINESWWQQVAFWSCRDQVSLPYVIWRSRFKHLGSIPGSRDKSAFFSFRPH